MKNGSLFIVILREAQSKAIRRLEAAYPTDRVCRVTDNAYLVAMKATVDSISRVVGLTGDGSIKGLRGVVFRLESSQSAGYDRTAVWQWLEQFGEE